ncbi:type IV toxin-antitoxin system AbiEi family antitoxin domain-containing protein [Nocardioides sp. Leaf285]|uniref:type IV toxin-antitoxin system AbiEi family antitoxin domain-containing protein n=1 Tax=Nocardioides sp. Leaf285 TaxID=1736322 RepID=UPI0007035BC9|nr:type IV toxin-antitoxin system AbiEi family antitoxin domain-containing protein [Nocardioides sp. Leaf285]KQP63062.1 hypothetical protein ASF47_18800 [Nocardioides sp. Leaf285]
MSSSRDFLTTEQAANLLGVSATHVRRLADHGDLTRVARGLLDATSVERHQQSAAGHRTRVWAEHTAWGAIALLSGIRPDWLGSVQTSRLRGALREISVMDLVRRTRDRATVHTMRAHSSALDRARVDLVWTDSLSLGLVEGVGVNGVPFSGLRERDLANRADGYLRASDFETFVRRLALRPDPTGNLTLRTTDFDIETVRTLAQCKTPVLTALDAATALDPRERGMGLLALDSVLKERRGRAGE